MTLSHSKITNVSHQTVEYPDQPVLVRRLIRDQGILTSWYGATLNAVGYIRACALDVGEEIPVKGTDT